MSSPLQQTIEALAKEKGIEPEVIISAIEDAVLTAYLLGRLHKTSPRTFLTRPRELARAASSLTAGLPASR